MAAKIERAALGQLKAGQLADFFAALSERTMKTTRDGKPYYSVRFRDRDRSAAAPVWDNSPLYEACESTWKVGQHFKIRAVYLEHAKYGSQIEIQNIRLVTPEDWMDGYDPAAFVPTTRFNVDELFQELLGFAEAIEDKPLRDLTCGLLKSNEAQIKSHPAASHNHHAYRGGYIEHTVSVVRSGNYLADKYRTYYPEMDPPLNKDLILAGCILHDIGKLRELEWTSESPNYTVEGNLIGHILIGRDMVRDAAAKIPELSVELLLYLEHIILAHQGTPEWGSPKTPHTPEALLVHFADDIDAKMNMFVHILKGYDGEDSFTDGNNIFRRKLLKKRTV